MIRKRTVFASYVYLGTKISYARIAHGTVCLILESVLVSWAWEGFNVPRLPQYLPETDLLQGFKASETVQYFHINCGY